MWKASRLDGKLAKTIELNKKNIQNIITCSGVVWLLLFQFLQKGREKIENKHLLCGKGALVISRGRIEKGKFNASNPQNDIL